MKLAIKPGKLTATATVAVYGDRVVEPDETFFVELSSITGAASGRATGIGTILNDDVPPAPGAPSIDGSSPSSPSSSTTPSLFGTADGGSSVSLYANSSCAGTAVATDTAETFDSAGIAVAVLPNSSRAFTAKATNGGGSSPCSGLYTYTNVTPPNAPSILGSYPTPPASSTTPLLYGSAPAATTVEVFANGTCAGGAVGAGPDAEFGSMGIAVTVPTDATTTFSANATGIGGTSICSTVYSYTHVSPPAAPVNLTSDPPSPSSNLNPAIIGSAAAGSTVRVYGNDSCSGAPVATGTSAAFSSTGLAVSAVVGTNTFSATATNAGGPSLCSDPYTYTGTHPTYFEVEPNGNPAAADSVAGSIPTDFHLVNGSLGTVSDQDYYRFDLGAAATVRFHLVASPSGTCTSAPNFRVQIFGGVSDTTTGPDSCPELVAHLAAGVNYVVVSATGGSAGANYRLERAAVADGVTEAEANDSVATATPLTGAEAVVSGEHPTTTDADYYAVTVPAGASIRAETIEGGANTCESLHVDTFLTLYAPNGTTVLASNDDGGRGYCSLIDGSGFTPAMPSASNLPAGTYYVKVTSSSLAAAGDGIFSYRLHVLIG